MDTMRRKKDFNYFNYFLACAKAANDAAKFLHASLNDFQYDTVRNQLADMHKIENDADLLRHEMLFNLAHEFMTPIEREDIVSLAQELDNVVDSIEDVMQSVYMYNLDNIRPDALKFSALIVNCTEALLHVMEEFSNFRKSKVIKAHTIEVNNIESVGDKLFTDAMHSLFIEPSADSMTRLIWMNMYERLEQCLDECEDVIDIIEGVIMKNT